MSKMLKVLRLKVRENAYEEIGGDEHVRENRSFLVMVFNLGG